MVKVKTNKIVLQHHEPGMNPSTDDLARVIMGRIGLDPRKKGSTDKMYRTMIELYERAKVAHREQKPESAVMTVEEMAMYAGITRQTMYDYLRRWIDLNMIQKTSYIKDNKVIIGYKLNGSTIEQSYEKAMMKVTQNMETTKRLIQELQKQIKNEKISQSQKQNNDEIMVPENSEVLPSSEVTRTD